MLKKILRAIIYCMGVCGMVFVKLLLINILPIPFMFIDVCMLFFVISIMRGAKGGIVWFAFAVYMIIDMLATSAFGTELIAGVFSVLGVFWFFEEVFTNLSIWTAGILTIFGMTVFRILYVLFSLFSLLWMHHDFSLSYGLLKLAGLEIICTSIISIPLYAIVVKVINVFTKERIRYS